LESDKIKGKHAVSWTIEFGRETPKDGKWDIMTVESEAEAVRQAKEYLDMGLVVNAIKRPDGSIAHDSDQLSALYHGFDDLALKLAEKRMPRNRGEATEATPPLDTPATELARSASEWPIKLLAWCKGERERLQRQLDMLKSGQVRIGENRGIGWVDTSSKAIERVVAAISELDQLLAEYGERSAQAQGSQKRALPR
jgi:hypothetical protein